MGKGDLYDAKTKDGRLHPFDARRNYVIRRRRQNEYLTFRGGGGVLTALLRKITKLVGSVDTWISLVEGGEGS